VIGSIEYLEIWDALACSSNKDTMKRTLRGQR